MSNFNIGQQNVLERIIREAIVSLRDEYVTAGTPVEERPAWLPRNTNQLQHLLGQFSGYLICSRTDDEAARKSELTACADRAEKRGLKYGILQYRAGLDLTAKKSLSREESAAKAQTLQTLCHDLAQELGIELPELVVTDTAILMGERSSASQAAAPAQQFEL